MATTLRFSREEVVRRGEALYESTVRALVETSENIGKIVSIDIESGDYAIDADPIKAGVAVRLRHPDAILYGKRIGYAAAFAIGGAMTRTPS